MIIKTACFLYHYTFFVLVLIIMSTTLHTHYRDFEKTGFAIL